MFSIFKNRFSFKINQIINNQKIYLYIKINFFIFLLHGIKISGRLDVEKKYFFKSFNFQQNTYCGGSRSFRFNFEPIISTKTVEYLSSTFITSKLVSRAEASLGLLGRDWTKVAWNSLKALEFKTSKLFSVTSVYFLSLDLRSVKQTSKVSYVLLIKARSWLCCSNEGWRKI